MAARNPLSSEHVNGNGTVAHDVLEAGLSLPTEIVKRDGRVVPFDIVRIEHAMERCFASIDRTPQAPISDLARRVVNIMAAKSHGERPTVEGVQDIVEMVLQAAGEFEAAKHYILYRAERAKERQKRPIPDDVRAAFDQSRQYFPTPIQQFQFFDKYSRFNYDFGRRETWIETVDRSVDYMYELAGERLPRETYERIRRAILEMRAMPSMRLLAMAGPAARRNNIAIYNCFSGDERVLTYEQGLVPLRAAVGTAHVLNIARTWVPAEIRSFGQQQTVEVEFGRYKAKKSIRATLNHYWVLTDGRRVTTEELHEGDAITYTVAPRHVDTSSIDYRLGLMHGIIYGDGAETYVQGRNNGYVIRLCGDSRELLEYFADYPHSFPPSYGGDPVVYLYDDFAKTHHLKDLPDVSETDDYLVGFIRGWFAADGYLAKNGQILFAADESGEAWLRRVGPKVGFDFGFAVLMSDETNFGVRTKKVRNVEVRRASVQDDDFILAKHLRNYRQATTERDWKFLGIVPGSMRVEEVFCATVPDTHTFTLADGIVTGNCSYQPVESIDSFVEALIISMAGCGVGYSVESKYVENFPRIRRQTGKERLSYYVEDSAEGWADALRFGLQTWFDGGDVRFDLSGLRPAGAPLRIKGGRASGPEPFRTMLDFVRSRVLARQGSFLRPIDAHDMMCAVGNAAVSGGVRRTAMISLFDYEDLEMLQCKSGDFERDNSQRWNANNSAVWPDGGLTQQDFIQQFLEMVQSERGEPGVFNREAANVMKPARRAKADFGTNPCVTGDTWVAVADGRGRVRMADLVREGRDVDVFTVKDGQLAIRTMRNPRKTGTQVPVFRVTFADGTHIRATANHRFAMLDGGERTTAELQYNDALMSMNVYSYQKRGLPAVHKVPYDQPGSYRMLQFGSFRKSEHRVIYAHHAGEPALSGAEYHIHHRDNDGRNNQIANLERLAADAHAALHRERMLGDRNPARRLMNPTWRKHVSAAVSGERNGNAKAISNSQLKAAIEDFIRQLGYRPSIQEYIAFAKANGLPQSFQQYRRAYFGGTLQETLVKLADRLGFTAAPYAKRQVKCSELPVHVRDGVTYVSRSCEVCGKQYEVRFNRREQATCSLSCSQQLYYRLHGSEERRAILQQAHQDARSAKRRNQVHVYNDLVLDLGRHPSKKEWAARCKQQGISPEISRVSSPFSSWRSLQAEAGATNHRVVTVEPDGYEDVFTGTVDETHTFFSIGSARYDQKQRAEMAYVLSWQCGEINLRPWEFCNLTAAVARVDDSFESLREKVEVATIIGSIQSLATYFPGLRPMWAANCEEERLLGVDITGQMDSPVAQDAQVKRQLKEIAIEVNRQTAQALGINASASITCVKPSGNSSQLLNCASGLHARWAPYYIRNVRVSAHSPLFKVLRDEQVPMDPENGQTVDNATTWVVHFPMKSPDGAITRNQRSAVEQCEFWLQNKLYWTEHNPSCTVTYRPDEVIDLMKWVWDHREQIGGLSFLPSFDAQYAQMPYVEITKEEYERLSAHFPEIDFSRVWRYEEEDLTTAAQELACVAGVCEVEIVPQA